MTVSFVCIDEGNGYNAVIPGISNQAYSILFLFVNSMRSKSILLSSIGLVTLILGSFILALFTFAQGTKTETVEFKRVVETRLSNVYQTNLKKICPIDSDATAERIFKEYGAIFVSAGTMLPTRCIFNGDAELQDYQVRIKTESAVIGGVTIQLQKPAMTALLKARKEAAQKNLKITPRGGSLAAKRSFKDTVGLWNSRFLPGLNYWIGRKKITTKQADQLKKSGIREQIGRVLKWEEEGLFFSKDFSKSILFSVAAPGASQHNFMLALDVEQFASKEVRKILADNGWFQTVKSDLPHFTYLGLKESELPDVGLKTVTVGSQKFWIPNYSE